ncbi:ATPase [Ectopseudomonas composti]|uniref:histidine kinase n=2 Tax=Ectopseudomonas composti TaxID=658457 RepID=A0ABN0S9J0_9GAMM|nr:hybrid sensor histidine kinase/response regulator [Pseudomonas composti]EZH78826.1 ATPase [Pseudomonas composti]
MRLIVLLTLTAGMAATALVTGVLQQSNQKKVNDALIEATERAADAVTKRIELYQYGLRGARGAVLASGEHGITREGFRNYSKTRDVDREFPGARGFGFIRRVPSQQQDSFLALARADGMPDFQIRQLAPHDGERFVIQYIEPVETNRQAVGLDIASERNRRSAAMAAMASGEVRISGPITLVQATGSPLQSFLILLPIYRDAVTPGTLEARMSQGIGWSYAPLLTEEVLQGLTLDREGLHMLLSDITDADQPQDFFGQHADAQLAEEVASHTLTREVYGRRWQIELHAQDEFINQLNLVSPRMAALTGTLLSLLLAVLMNVILVNRQRHRQILGEQARSAAIVESSSDGIIGQDLDGRVLSWNRGAERIFGYSAAEMLGQKLLELTVPEHLGHEERKSLQYIAAHREVDNFDTQRRRKDGHLVDVSVSISPLLDDTGTLIGLSKTVRDISAQKAAEARILELNANLEEQVSERTQELRKLNLLLNNVLQSASEVSIIATDLDGVIRVFNRGAERLLGYDAEEVVGLQTPAIFHLPEEVQARSEELSQEYAQPITGFRVFVHKSELEQAESREWTYVRKDGSLRSVTLLVTAMRDVGGNLAGYLGIALDLSKEVRLRREALAAHDQVSMAARVAELGIWSWTPADNRLHWNERMFELYDYPLELREQGLEYRLWRDRIHPDDQPATEANLREVMAGKATFDRVFRIVRPDGQVLYIQPGAHVERDLQGTPVKITGINRDITAQLQLEAGLRHAKEQADAASAAKSAFLANMSHEIRTPMNAVLGMLQLVQATELNARQLDYVLKAQSAAHSLLGLLNDILDYSKIEAGKLQLDLHDFELEPMLRDLAVVLAGNQGDKDIEVMFDVDTALPAVLQGDSLRLQQVLINLAGNALKFTHGGQVVVSLHQLQRTAEQVRLRVAVSDTGIGISEHQLQRIFDGFTQAEASTTRRYGGTGLGLVICKRLVELMGGTLNVESQLGAGSRFWFDIELGARDDAEPLVHTRDEPEHLRLLIVDDNLLARQLLQQTILDLGWHADTADSGGDALLRVQQAQQPYDIVLLDWRMPGMDGLEVAQRIRESATPHRPPPTVIMITAHGREVLADRYGEADAPFAGFLTKPVTPRQLVACILQARHGHSGEAPVPGYKLGQRLQGLRLLVVEDNALNRQVARELLAGEGADVSLAEGGLEGVQLAQTAQPPFDTILMDIQMPDIDGLEATRRIRQHPAHKTQPIIAMTANVSNTDRDQCLAAGMNDHVSKPIDIEKLVAVIRQWCGLESTQPSTTVVDQPIEDQTAILKRFGGNLALLHSMLEVFPADLHQQLDQLQRHRQNGDTAAMLRSLHSLKGSSGTIGARQLSARFADLEKRVAEHAGPFIEDAAWLDAVRQQLDDSCERLRAMFATTTTPQTVPSAVADLQWTPALQALNVQLQEGNLGALESVQNLSTQVPDALRGDFEAIHQAVDALDFHRAQQLLHALRQSLEGD